MTAARPTGPDLLSELRIAANRAGLPLKRFIAPLITSSADNFLSQLGRAQRPLQQTIDRVRACIEGRPLPPARQSPFKGHCGKSPRQAADSEFRLPSREVERRRALTERAHAQRRPGETLDQAVQRLTAADCAIARLQTSEGDE